jgi:hypothetical protein
MSEEIDEGYTYISYMITGQGESGTFYLFLAELIGGGYEGYVEHSTTALPTTFSDRKEGSFLIFSDYLVWARPDWWTGVFYIFEDNPPEPTEYDYDILHAIGRSLIPN